MKHKSIFKTLLAVALLLFSVSPVLADPKPKLGKYVKVFKGSEGLYLSVVNLGPRGNNEALLLIEGVDHAWDDKVMVAKRHEKANKTEYSIPVNGNDYFVFINRSGHGDVYLKGVKSPNRVSYHEDRSKQIKPEEILNKLIKQQKP